MDNLSALFQDALMALKANALRSVLTLLGVIIGVASVVTMVAIGDGAKQEVENRINNLGANVLTIRPGAGWGARRGGAGSADPFSDKDMEAIQNEIPGILAASGRVSSNTQLVSGGVNWSTQVLGVHEGYLEIKDQTVTQGRPLNERDLVSSRKVALVGQTIVKEMFGGSTPVGQRMRINNVPFEVIGVLSEKGTSGFGQDGDDLVLVPLTTARKRLVGGNRAGGPDYLTYIEVEVAPGYDLKTVEAQIKTLMKERRKIGPGQDDDFFIYNRAEFVSARSETQRTLTVLLAAMAGVSLIVGGIGIMNIMLVSVTERTKEIGLRLAIGARQSDISQQFLIEAVTLSAIGGVIGIGIGMSLSFALSKVGGWAVLISPSAIALAVIFSVIVGVFFGAYPARKASQLNPIDALRTE